MLNASPISTLGVRLSLEPDLTSQFGKVRKLCAYLDEAETNLSWLGFAQRASILMLAG